MKKVSKLTYAKRARNIISKYKRRLGEKLDGNDSLAQAAMQKELDELMEEQENAKASMVQNQYQEMAYGGGLPKMDGFGSSYVPNNKYSAANRFFNPYAAQENLYGQPFTVEPSENMVGQKFIPNTQTSLDDQNNSWFSQIPNESKIGAGIQGLTALTQMGLALGNKPKNITYKPTNVRNPEEVRADEQLAATTRAYRGAQNNLRYLSPSQYMASMSDMATREAATKAGIIEGVDNINVGARNENNRYRSEIEQRDEMMNNRMQMYNNEQGNQYMQNISTGIGNIGAVGAGFAKDEGSRKMQSSMMQFMNQANYGSRNINGYPVQTYKTGALEYYVDPRDNSAHWEEAGKPITQKEFVKKVAEHYKRINP